MKSITQSHRIVCLEDNYDLSRLIELSLRPWPTAIHLAHDGFAGLQLIRDIRPNLILLDIGLPGLNGYEIINAVRDDSLLCETPIVVLTAVPRDPRIEAVNRVNLYLHKPFTPRTLRDQLLPFLPKKLAETAPLSPPPQMAGQTSNASGA